MIEGIDISHHQATTPPLSGLGFVFVRATYGTFADDRYPQHAAAVRAAGLVLGAYAFGRFGDGVAQARALLAAVGPSVRLVALDYEKDGNNPHMTPDQARAFIRTIHATGRRCGLYASDSGYPELGQSWRWVARWGSRPARAFDFWQYAVTGSPRLDRDRFEGSMGELRALADLPPEPAAGWRVSVHPVPPAAARRFLVFQLDAGGTIRRRSRPLTRGFSAACTAPAWHAWESGARRRLVRILDGSLAGSWVLAGWAHPVP